SRGGDVPDRADQGGQREAGGAGTQAGGGGDAGAPAPGGAPRGRGDKRRNRRRDRGAARGTGGLGGVKVRAPLARVHFARSSRAWAAKSGRGTRGCNDRTTYRDSSGGRQSSRSLETS